MGMLWEMTGLPASAISFSVDSYMNPARLPQSLTSSCNGLRLDTLEILDNAFPQLLENASLLRDRCLGSFLSGCSNSLCHTMEVNRHGIVIRNLGEVAYNLVSCHGIDLWFHNHLRPALVELFKSRFSGVRTSSAASRL